MKINEILLNEFKDEMKTTRKFYESISEDLLDFRVHKKSQSIVELINHTLPIPSWVGVIAQNPELDWAKVTPPPVLTSKEEILKQFDTNVALGIKAFEETNNDQLLEAWTMKNSKADKVFFTGNKLTAIRRYVLSHTVHHRAQLGVFLRINDVNVPGSYVDSADESLF